jgi:hypothetical protein
VSYVAGGWAAATALIVLYAWRTLRRGKTLARNLPPGEQAPGGHALGHPTLGGPASGDQAPAEARWR